MILKGKALEDTIEKYEASAVKNWNTYQATGMTRYENAWRNAEDLADTLRVAQTVVDDHTKMIHYRGQISQLAHQAQRYMKYRDPRTATQVLSSLIALAKMDGLIREE